MCPKDRLRGRETPVPGDSCRTESTSSLAPSPVRRWTVAQCVTHDTVGIEWGGCVVYKDVCVTFRRKSGRDERSRPGRPSHGGSVPDHVRRGRTRVTSGPPVSGSRGVSSPEGLPAPWESLMDAHHHHKR